ncbi:DNA-binding PucR family transcriptional regulator [Microbacteriaceae bacterium MWH-Ta3]|nr:DNA-binding PucR family transcriptional regulator [Microbacteriaceae bacterium MWH-Ta3]
MSLTKDQALAWLKSLSGDLSTAVARRLVDTLPWYSAMPPSRRSAVGVVAQAGISSFVRWYENPESLPWAASDVFGAAPRELLRSVSLQQTLQLIRVTVEVVEEYVAEGDHDLREAILRYSREVAFSAADVYARAAEDRGLWDARLEALVVDSILSGEYEAELPSRIAALGWNGHGEVAVLVGTTPTWVDVDHIRRVARHTNSDVLIGVQGNRLVVVIGRHIDDSVITPPTSFPEIAAVLSEYFGNGSLVLGPTVPSVVEAVDSARAALAGFAVAHVWRHAPRPVLADDLLPERALAGDKLARATLLDRVYRPIREYSDDMLATLWAYLDSGRSLEVTARELFVHPNTVRYRLKRMSEILGWDPANPRDALIVHTALMVGALAEPESARARRPS